MKKIKKSKIPDTMKNNYNLKLGIYMLERYIFKIKASKDYDKYLHIIDKLEDVVREMNRLDKL